MEMRTFIKCLFVAYLFVGWGSTAQAQTTMFNFTSVKAVAPLGDIDGDGFPEFILGKSPTLIVSSYDQHIVAQLFDPTPATNGYGSAVARIPDVNGDLLPDVAVGEFTEAAPNGGYGVVHVFSSLGAYLYSVHGNPGSMYFGQAIVGLDGSSAAFITGSKQEHVQGTPTCPNCTVLYAGAAYRFATNGTLIQRHVSPLPQQLLNFGSAFGAAGDTDGDGVQDFLIGEPNQPALGRYGKVHLYSGASGNLIRTHNEASGGSYFGNLAGKIGDLNGDGRSEYIMGGAAFYPSLTPEVHVVDGATGAYIYSYTSIPQPFTHWSFGSGGSGIGDVTGDGIIDFAIGDNFSDVIFSGATGAPAIQLSGQALENVPLGDVNLDGTPDILIRDSVSARVVSPVTLLTRSSSINGNSCGGFGSSPALTIGNPTVFGILGSPLSFRIGQRAGVIQTLLVISEGSSLNAPLGNGCTLSVNPGSVVLSQLGGSVSTVAVTLNLPVPRVPSAAGATFTAQVLGIDANGVISYSNGLTFTLGF